ncbi:hypothetical protein RhiirA4_539374 [Rhizophagus irregularis]|uniref:Uncharacterized protein n=1 Tax=Rhizophagus irregularis TaxID=588596 RepID=A0A2I1G3C5_9GLOM|nr:hypothetical protein RhiirA4_539374 [Rhizophagus irregularis]
MCKKEIIVEQFKDKPWTDKNTFGRNVTKDLSKSLFITCGPVPARDVGIPTGCVPVRISVFMEYESKNEITDKAIWMIVKKMRGKELIKEKRIRIKRKADLRLIDIFDKHCYESEELSSEVHEIDGIGMKVASNKEIVFIEISGGPENAILKHVREDTEGGISTQRLPR